MVYMVANLVLAVIVALLAARKGYNGWLWLFTPSILGLIVLSFYPFVNEKSKLPSDVREKKRKEGNYFGIALVVVNVIVTTFVILLRS